VSDQSEWKPSASDDSVDIPIPVDYTARVCAASGNPVAVAMEYQALIENVMEHLIGCPIEIRQSDNSVTRKTWYYKGTDAKSPNHKGCFGHVTGFHGMTETQQRGALHFHVLLYGSLTPRLLELGTGSSKLTEEISKALDSMYTAEIPKSYHVRDYLGKAMKKNYRSGAKENCKFPKFPPKAIQCPPSPEDQEQWDRCFCETVLQTGIHVHTFTCAKPYAGTHGCRNASPKECIPCTEGVQLVAPPKKSKERVQKRDANGKFASNKVQNEVIIVKEEVDPPLTAKSRDYETTPVRPLDERIVVWELKRPLLEPLPKVPISEELLSAVIKDPTKDFDGSMEELEQAKAFCIDQIDQAVRPGNPEEVSASMRQWLFNVKPANVIVVYVELNEFLVDRNGYVTDANKMIANATGSSTNAIMLGNTQQSRASLFYISSYITKNKMALEHCLSALSRAQAHIEKYPSQAEDAGTKKRTIQHLMQRVLNTMYCHRELSDTQVALALLNGLGAEGTSDAFAYYGAAYMNNFIDAELKQNCASSTGPLNSEVVGGASEDESQSDVHLEEPPSDQWGSFPTPKTAVLGPAQFMKRPKEGGEKGETEHVPVHYQMHWRYRGKDLAQLTPAEYYAIISIEQMTKTEMKAGCAGAADGGSNENLEASRGDPSTGGQVGRVANRTFKFDCAHPLHKSHCQRLRSKQVTLIHNGYAPKHPGPMPICPETQVEDYHRHFKVWKGKADAFAKYYLCTFRALEQVYSGEHKITNAEDFTWAALCKWVESMEHSIRLVDRLRVAAMFNHIYGFRSKSEHSDVLNAYRMRARTLWSEEKKAENKAVYSGFRTYRQDLQDAEEGGDDFGGSTTHVFRAQDLTDMYKELKYCSDQMETLNFVFPNGEDQTGNHSGSEYSAVEHEVVHVSCKDAVKDQAIALVAAKPAELLTSESDCGGDDISDPSPVWMKGASSKAEEESNATLTATEFIKSRVLSKGQHEVVKRFQEYFSRLGTPDQRLLPPPPPPKLLLTGDPGAGKSYLIETIVELAFIMGVGHVQTTSFNGIAAVNIDGITLCKLLKIGHGTPTDTDFSQARCASHGDDLYAARNDMAADKLVLFIVDEVSTLDAAMIAMIDARLQQVMGNDKEFGGIAMLFCGDFNQLGAVQKTFLLDDLLQWSEYQQHHADKVESPVQVEDQGVKRRSKTKGGPRKVQRASKEQVMRVTLEKNKSERSRKAKDLNTSLYSRYAVKGMVHRGCKLFSELERFHMAEQRRADDPVHMKFVKKLASGLTISWKDLDPYKTLDRTDGLKKEWQFAPILVSTNRERLEITRHKAKLFAKLHKTHVFKWRSNAKNWKNKPQDPSFLYEENSMLWQYFVCGSEAFLTANVNPSLGLANGTPVVCHSLVLDSSTIDYVQDQIQLLPFGSEIILDTAPLAVNMTIQTGLDGKEPSRAKKKQLEALKKHSVVDDAEEIVITISEKSDRNKSLKMKNGSPLLGNITSVEVTPIFAYDLAFAMTVHKAQGRTMKKVVIALTSRPLHYNQLEYASVFVGMSRVKKGSDIRLLRHGRGSTFGRVDDAMGYLAGLLPKKSINIYNAGFTKDNRVWNRKKSMRAKF